MNPYSVYRNEWYRALAAQAESDCYNTFVAMPFQEHFSYRSRQVMTRVIWKAADRANEAKETPRRFARPATVAVPRGAAVITDEIAHGIVYSHLFLADVTFENAGVLLETGSALALKPLQQIILITQGKQEALHFDLRGNNVIRYSPSGAVDQIAKALISAATSFERQLDEHVRTVQRHLSPDSVHLLLTYGRFEPGFSLHSDDAHKYFPGPDSRLRFESAARELRTRDLLWTDLAPTDGGFRHGMHPTELGKLLITQLQRTLSKDGE